MVLAARIQLSLISRLDLLWQCQGCKQVKPSLLQRGLKCKQQMDKVTVRPSQWGACYVVQCNIQFQPRASLYPLYTLLSPDLGLTAYERGRLCHGQRVRCHDTGVEGRQEDVEWQCEWSLGHRQQTTGWEVACLEVRCTPGLYRQDSQQAALLTDTNNIALATLSTQHQPVLSTNVRPRVQLKLKRDIWIAIWIWIYCEVNNFVNLKMKTMENITLSI